MKRSLKRQPSRRNNAVIRRYPLAPVLAGQLQDPVNQSSVSRSRSAWASTGASSRILDLSVDVAQRDAALAGDPRTVLVLGVGDSARPLHGDLAELRVHANDLARQHGGELEKRRAN